MSGAAAPAGEDRSPGDDPADDSAGGWRRTSPLGMLALGVRGLGQAILPLAAIMYGSSSADAGPLVALVVGTVVIAAALLAVALGWWRTRYRVGAADIRLHSGILGRSARSVPLERIQDVSLEQGPLARLLGLVEVRFETGAGGQDELKLVYVTQAEGAALRELVRARLDLSAPTPPPRADGAAGEAAPLFAMGPRRILLFGLFEFSLVVFAVLAGAAQQFDFLLPFDIWDVDYWEERLAGADGWLGAWLAGLGWLSRILGVAAALAVIAALGLTTGIVRTFAREYGFRLERTAKGFRRRRGLFTRTDVVMPVHRVQALSVTTGPLRRLGGWHGLAFISLAQEAGSAHHQVAPFAQGAEIAPVARAAGFALPGAGEDWRRPSRPWRRDRALVAGALPLPAAIAALAFGQYLAALALAGLGAAIAAGRYLLSSRDRYALDGSQILATRGLLAPRLTIAAREKLQSVEIVQGPLARRGGYADTRFGLAGGRLDLRGLPLAEAYALRDAVLGSITAVDFSQLPR